VLIASAAAFAFFEAHQAAEQRDHALALASRNEAVTEFLNTLITEAAGSDKPVAVSDMLERSEALVSSEYRDIPEHRAAVLDMLGLYYHTNGQDTRAEPLLRKALDAARNSSDGDLRRKLTCDHAMTLAGLGKVEEGIRALNTVIDDPQTSAQQSADCLEYLAWIAQDTGDAAGALKYGKLAIDRLHEVGHPLPSVEATYLASMGYAEHLNGRKRRRGPLLHAVTRRIRTRRGAAAVRARSRHATTGRWSATAQAIRGASSSCMKSRCRSSRRTIPIRWRHRSCWGIAHTRSSCSVATTTRARATKSVSLRMSAAATCTAARSACWASSPWLSKRATCRRLENIWQMFPRASRRSCHRTRHLRWGLRTARARLDLASGNLVQARSESRFRAGECEER